MNQSQINFCREQWIPALRSGEYQQTKEVLRQIESDGTEGYCCLGVCASLFDDVVWVERIDFVDIYDPSYDEYFEEEVNRPYAVTADFVVDDAVDDDVEPVANVALIDVFGERAGVSEQTMKLPPTFDELIINLPNSPNPLDVKHNNLIDLAELNDGGWTFAQIAEVIEFICDEWEEYNANDATSD